jgi:hypothetical protein
MSRTSASADSVLAIDVGTINTRAALLDVVDGRYRFIASGTAPTTVDAPYKDIGEGIGIALDRLQAITGRVIIGSDGSFIIPTRVDGSGVDKIVATLSAGPPLKVIVLGLLEDLSLGSAHRVAKSTYTKVVDSVGLNDPRNPAERIDAIIRHSPDLIIVAGGTNGGASQSVIQLLETVGLAGYLIPKEKSPEVLFAGNEALQEEVKQIMGNIVPLNCAPNIRPTLNTERVSAVQIQLAKIVGKVRSRRISGVQELDRWSEGKMIPSATAFGRIIRFLSKVYDPNKGVLGVDVGAGSTMVAAGFSGKLSLGVYPEYGLGSQLKDLLAHTSLDSISRWLHEDVPKDYLRDYLYTKALYPASVPATREDLDIEQALARQAMRLSINRLAAEFLPQAQRSDLSLLPSFEPILASGSVLTRAPSKGNSLLMLLDGIQPVGITTLVLDESHIISALGSAAAVNPTIPVQVLETSAFVNLGTVISPLSSARVNTPILKVRMQADDGNELDLIVKQGSLATLSLPIGQSARLNLIPLQRTDVGMGGPGRGGRLQVVGGTLGIVFDARGRPIKLSSDVVQRREANSRWLIQLGG